MKTKNRKALIVYVTAVGLSIFILFFFITGTWIGYDVRRQCDDARHEYGGDCVEALTSLLKDDHRGYRVRNHAIWALGQLGDRRALPVLERYYTGNIPDREPIDATISQYELKKAINLTRGGPNITAFLWRGFINGN